MQTKIVPLTSQKTWFTTFGWACKTSASARQAASSAPGYVLALVRAALPTHPHAVLLQPLLLLSAITYMAIRCAARELAQLS